MTNQDASQKKTRNTNERNVLKNVGVDCHFKNFLADTKIPDFGLLPKIRNLSESFVLIHELLNYPNEMIIFISPES